MSNSGLADLIGQAIGNTGVCRFYPAIDMPFGTSPEICLHFVYY